MKQRSDEVVLKSLLSKIDRIPISGCWLWTSSIMANGYGQIGYKGKNAYAHRVSWILHNGPIDNGEFVLHRCDVRCCVNPSHLFLGSSKDNMRDMISKGRQNFNWKKGKPPNNKGKRSSIAREKHGMAKLTENDVAEIRRRYSLGETQKSLGVEYGVIQPHISRIVRNENWN